ncbi:MAG: hypothetical protein MI724_18935 [Spirochaetales bacterium]|nr:hypothetical protein [Spirochaetales bacterium]
MENPRYYQMVRAAELYYERHLGQREIAKVLGNSTSTVSRLLTDAQAAGIVEITIRRFTEKKPELSERLRKDLALRDVVVVASGPTHENALQSVGAAAAELLLSVIENGMTVGISWGLEIYHMVQAVKETALQNVKVIQMAGSLGEGDPAIDGPELALRLAERLRGSYRYIHAPAAVESKEFCETLLQQPQIRETLEQASRAHIMITGIGAMADRESGLERAGYLTKEERLAYLSAGAVGHVLAKMFDIDGNGIPDYNERVVAMPFEHLRKADWSICICEAPWKVKALKAALRGRFFNTVVITEEAAQALLDMAT